DLIMATPVFECLRENCPDAKITALTRAYNAKIIGDAPWADHVIACDDSSWSGIQQTADAVRNCGADTALLLPNSIRSWLPVRLGGVTQIYGYRRGARKPLVQGPLPKREGRAFLPMPMVDYYLDLCRWLGLKVADSPKPSLFVSDQLQQQAQQLLDSYAIAATDRVIGLNPGAKFGASKCWPAEYFAELADLLEAEFSCKLLLFVGPGEEEIAAQIMAGTKSQLINTGPDKIDLALLKPMIQRCDMLITNDTGPRHYATAFDLPAVVIMGPTDPRYTASNLDKSIVLRQEMDCSPCHKKVCPADHQCMRDILPQQVTDAARRLIQTIENKED
ncbi:MAG: lipopolysaccharide heptosyltransferase II, partial [Desulfuromonadales bacterium]|nr:lipopolysaccharide heptosyltransferase II [Desulfuromonadales bacterium]